MGGKRIKMKLTPKNKNGKRENNEMKKMKVVKQIKRYVGCLVVEKLCLHSLLNQQQRI